MVADTALGFLEEGFLYAQIDRERCVECGACERVCPVQQPSPRAESIPELHPNMAPPRPRVYACYNQNQAVREQSSSGGVFSGLAEAVLGAGGVVFGAGFDTDLHLRHMAVEHPEELATLRGSKYVQSDLGDCFQQVRAFLESGREVLFSGTPCQAAGLTRYLGRRYPNLLVVDVVCHGVPSPGVFARYLSQQTQPIQRINFRDKTFGGWKGYNVTLTGTRNTQSTPHAQEPYMQGFLHNLYLRPVCHRCLFRSFGEQAGPSSDLTLGDYWGIRHHAPALDDNRGTSLVILHTAPGEQAFAHILASLTARAMPLATALSGNRALTRSARPHRQRALFFSLYPTADSLRTLIPHLLKATLLEILQRKFRGTYRKLRRRFQ